MAGLKIYFCGSIRGGRDEAGRYQTIVNHLKTYGTVLTEAIADPTLTQEDRVPPGEDGRLHDRNMEWLLKSDVIVAEVTQPSLGVGYELGRAVENKKKTLALFRPDNASGKKLSAMIRGVPSNDGTFQVRNYSGDDVLNLIDEFMKELKKDI